MEWFKIDHTILSKKWGKTHPQWLVTHLDGQISKLFMSHRGENLGKTHKTFQARQLSVFHRPGDQTAPAPPSSAVRAPLRRCWPRPDAADRSWRRGKSQRPREVSGIRSGLKTQLLDGINGL